MSALELLPPQAEPPRPRPLQPVPEVEPPKPVAKAPEPEAGIAARAKMTVGLQQQVGNARAGEMAAPPKKEGPAEEKPKQAAELAPKKAEAGKAAPEKAEKPAPPSPRKAIAPAVHAVKDRATRAKTKKIGTPGLVASTQEAAKDPTTEEKRKASVSTVHKLDDAEAKKVRREEFKKALTKAMDAHMGQPKTKDEADQVMKSGGKKASAEMHGSLSTERDQAAGSMKSAAATEVAPQEGGKPPDMKTEAVGAPPAPVSAAPVVPPPLPPEQLDYSSDREPTDNAMSEAGVSKTQLEKGNEPEFNKTLSQRAEGEKHEAEAEAKYRKSETVIQAQTRAAAKGELGEELGAIHGAREMRIGDVTGQQNATKTKDAQERERVTTKINSIKEATRKEVNEILAAMEADAATTFEQGLSAAEAAYEKVFEDEKGGIGTWLTTWGDDWDELIEKSLATAKRHYLSLVELSIDDVSNVVDLKLVAAKKRVEQGRKEVDDFVQGLEGKAKEFGVEVQNQVSAEFDAMDSEIDSRRDALIDKLAQQFKASYERMSAKEEALREANKSLWKRIYDATVGLIKKILAFKDMLLNVLAKAADVIVDIISDPIGFLGNLVSGVMRGLEGFMSRIGEHLKKGLMEWLFGALAGAGLQLPETFDLQGIISIVLQVLGLTYANFRARAVAIVGEPVVSALEQAAEIFKIVATEGIPGLWKFIKEKLNDLKSMVMDAIFDFIKERVIIAGVTWVIGLLNPASAFFKACKAIYDIVMFFINRGSQILALVNAIIDSIAAIAKGNLDTAAKWVENALAKAIPVAIGFLAALLGLGDISGTIRKTIEKAQEPVNKAIDWAIGLAVKAVKAVGKAIGGLFGKKEEKAQEQKEKGADEQSAPLRGQVAQALDERLTAEHTPEEAAGIVKAVETEFKPLGLKSLALGEENEEGTTPILAEASPKLPLRSLARQVPKPRGRSVTSKVQILLSAPIEVPATLLAPADPTKATVPTGGAVWTPSVKKSQTLNAVTWNTSDIDPPGNTSHAEHQFVTYMESRQDIWPLVDKITIVNVSRSPCSICGEELAGFLEQVQATRPGQPIEAEIYWTKLHSTGAQPTSWQTLKELRGAHWQLHAPANALPPEHTNAVNLVKILK